MLIFICSQWEAIKYMATWPVDEKRELEEESIENKDALMSLRKRL